MVSPFLWFAFVPLVLLVQRWRRPEQEARDISWIVICLFCSALFGIVPALLINWATMRYLADMTPSLVILALIGVWQSYHLFRPKLLGTRVWFLLIVGLTVVSAVTGILLH
jgi:hypothetical protein